jgi:muramidase (phage lysozyme)
MNVNRKTFLDLIAYSEIGTKLLAGSDDGYNVLVGGSLFNDYSDHPRKLIKLPKLGISSTAAGRYQILARYFDAYKETLKLKDFSPASQDAIAIQLIKEQKALSDVDNNRAENAIVKCANIWASFPGAGYGQHEHSLSRLLQYYDNQLKKNKENVC